MSLAEQKARAKADIDEVHEAGFEKGHAQGEEAGADFAYNEFWDNFQLNGTRKDYRSSFGAGWSDITFKPKYDITPVSGDYMFAYSSITDLVAILKRQGVTLDFRFATGNNAFNMFIRESTITTLPVVDITNQGNCNYFFFRGRCLRSIEKLIFNETGTNQNLLTTFQECNELTDVVFEGAIGHDIDMRWSPLSRASIESVVAALGDTASGKTLTLKQSAVNAAFTTEEWETLVATKPNWTITLA